MRKLLTGLILCSVVALAEGPYLGTIRVFDGGSSNNCETTVLDAGFTPDGGTTQSDGGPTTPLYGNAGFAIPATPSGQPITQVCRTNVLTLTGRRTCDAGECPTWYLGQWLPLSVTPITSYNFTAYTGSYLADAGLGTSTRTCSGGLVTIAPTPGNSYAECQIFLRMGNE